MVESTTSSGPRARRSTETSQRLERARRRNTEQLAEQRTREQRVEAALRAFVKSNEKIREADQACQNKVAEYERKIARLREKTATALADTHARQAQAAFEIHTAGRTVEQVADLLELPQKATRRLIAAGRDRSAGGPPEPPATHTARGTGAGETGDDSTSATIGNSGSQSGKQGDLGGVQSQQHSPDLGLVPDAVTHGVGQGS